MSRFRSAVRPVLKALFGPAKRRIERDIFWARRRIILAMDLDRQAGCSALLPVGFRAGTLEDLEALTPQDHLYDDWTREIGRQRLAAGDTMMVGVHSGAVVFYAWLMYGQLDLFSQSYIPMSADRVYSYKVFTVARYRGLRICPAYYASLSETLRSRGYRQLLTNVLASNRESLRAHERAGFTRVGSFVEFQFGRRFRYWVPRRLRRWVASPSA